MPIPDTLGEGRGAAPGHAIDRAAATDEFNPARYHDTVKDRVLEAIQAKVDGQEIVADEPQAQETKIIDLMEALKASLAKSGKAPAGKRPGL